MNKGYSMIEVLTAVAVFSILALVSVNLFFSTTVGSTRDTVIRRVKQNGEFVLGKIEQSLRGAKDLTTNQQGVICDSDMRSISYLTLTDSIENWSVDSGRILYNSEYVTDPELVVVNDRFFIECINNPGSNTYFITISFTLSFGDGSSDKQEENYQETFATGVNLRNK